MGGLLGAFVSGAAQGGAEVVDRWMKFDDGMKMLQQRISMESSQKRADKSWEADEAQRRQTEQAGRISSRAEKIAGQRVEAPDDVVSNGNAAANAYENSFRNGLLSRSDANLGLKAAGDYVNENSTPASPTPMDYLKAQAEETGNWKDVVAAGDKSASIDTRMKIAELQNSAYMAKIDSQAQIALARLDAALAKAASSSGKLPSEAQMIEYLVRERIMPDKKAAADWVKEGKAPGESYEVKTKKDPNSGEETREVTVHGRGKPPAASDAQSGRKFLWKDGKLVPQ